MQNTQDAFRRADASLALARRRYGSALAAAHRRPHLDLEAAYMAELRAEIRAARALKRMMTE